MARKIEKLSEYNDLLCYVILKAPDHFPSDTGVTFDSVFTDLRENAWILKKRIKDDRQLLIIREMLEIAFEAYQQGQQKKAIGTLQELQGIVWPSYKMDRKYEIEAVSRIDEGTA